MKFSVIIPTHDPKYLKEAVASVLAQTEQDFEVVVVPNGLAAGGVPTIAGMDQRVKIAFDYNGSSRIGEIKNWAFMQAEGEILVELDHDDLLTPDALSEIGKAFLDSAADMVYGNFAEFSDAGMLVSAWDPTWNWKLRPVTLLGRDLMEVRSHEPMPATFAKVYFAPNHPRAWKRDFYRKLGGHNTELRVCDDHELLVRTYLSGKVHHVDKCLYLYRVHQANTIKSTQEEIKQTTWKIYVEYIERIVLRWCHLNGLPAFNLSRGEERPGWKWSDLGCVEHDIDGHQSFLGAIWADGVLNLTADRNLTMKKIHQYLAPGGWLLSSTPSASGKGAFANPMAKSHWNDLTFRYFTDKAFARTIGNSSVQFQPQRLAEYTPSQWHAENNCPYVYFDGVALKPGYDGPGPQDI